MTTDRYSGKPLLRLLELYVLWAIEELPADEEEELVAMAPKLRQIYGASGDWHDVVAFAVHLPQNTRSEIQQMWARNLQIARHNDVAVTPQDFAEMFVDANFQSE